MASSSDEDLLKEVVTHDTTTVPSPTFEVVDTTAETFNRLFPDTLIGHLVETNRYTKQEMGSEAYGQWELTHIPELKAFFGFSILMGLVHMPEVEDYWRVDQCFHYEPIPSCISQNRFRYLHFTDNSKAPATGRYVVVDEAMIPFKGCSSRSQYMPMKPVKRSVVADSKTGYVHKFDVYTGKKERVLLPDEENRTSHLQ
ncbi:hypothetical protein EMCRGX_G000313 [Ephydatia muelleri]